MATKNFLAFDLGAESGRAVLGTIESGRLTLSERHRFANPTGQMTGHLHWNLLAQWEELKTGLRKVAQSGVKLDGIGVDTWGVDFGLLSESGIVLGNPYMYRDSRTDGVMDIVFKTAPREEIFRQTGIQFMPFNTLFQVAAMVLERHPMLAAASTLLFMPDLFNYLFCGQRKSDFSIASTSQMYDPVHKRWARDLLEKLNIPLAILPEVVPCGTVLGNLQDDVASECGCGPVTVIAPAGHDTASAVAAVPAEGGGGEDWCYLSSGTWSLLGVEIAEPIINEKSLKYNYTNEGGVGGTIRFLKNIMGLWLVQECRRQWQREGREYSYTELTKLAGEAPALRCLIDPDDAPFAAPADMPRKIEAFCHKSKQRAPATPGEFVRTCLDSLALAYRLRLDGLEDVLGRRLKVIHIVGGGCQNELLNQMTADACNRPVLAGPVEATAAGNILIQAMAVGEVRSLAEIRGIVRASFPVKRYEPSGDPEWELAYTRFRELVG